MSQDAGISPGAHQLCRRHALCAQAPKGASPPGTEVTLFLAIPSPPLLGDVTNSSLGDLPAPDPSWPDVHVQQVR